MRLAPWKSIPTASSTAELWRGRAAAWQRSGLSAPELCASPPYAPSTLLGWSSCLRRDSAPTFLEGRPREAVVAAPPAELVVEVGAARVRVAAGFDTALLAAVVEALSRGAR